MAKQVRVSVKFANFDNGASPVLVLNASTSVAELKRQVAAAWPTGSPEGPPAAADIRAFAMGKILETGTLEQLPTFDYPTPVHVSARPSSKTNPVTARPSPGTSLRALDLRNARSPVSRSSVLLYYHTTLIPRHPCSIERRKA